MAGIPPPAQILQYWPGPMHPNAAHVPQQIAQNACPRNPTHDGPSWNYINMPNAPATLFPAVNPNNPAGQIAQITNLTVRGEPGVQELAFYNAGWGTQGNYVIPVLNQNTIYQNNDLLPTAGVKQSVMDRRQIWDIDQCHTAITHNFKKGQKLPFYAHLRPTGLLAAPAAGMDNLFYVPRHAVTQHGGIRFPNIPSTTPNLTVQQMFFNGGNRWTVLTAMAIELFNEVKWHNDAFIRNARFAASQAYIQAGNFKLNINIILNIKMI